MTILSTLVTRLRNSYGESFDEIRKAFYSGKDIGQSYNNFSGYRVSERTSLQLSAVWACVGLIANALAASPINVCRGQKDTVDKKPYNDSPVYVLLNRRPNSYMTAMTFIKYLAQSKLLLGNAYAAIQRDVFGAALSLDPIHPSRVTVYQAWELSLDVALGISPYELIYDINWPNGKRERRFSDDVLHIPNLGWDGKHGLSTIKHAANALGLANAAEASSASFFANGMQTDTVISYPKKVSPEAEERLREIFSKRQSGYANAHKPLILSDDGKVTPITLSAEDSQLLESREFSVIDICRFFGVAPAMVGETTKTTSWGSGIEQMGRWFNSYTMLGHYTAFEQEIDRKLMPRRGPGANKTFCEFDRAKLTKGDSAARASYFGTARGSSTQPGWLTINEIRAQEGQPPITGGDELLWPIGASDDEDDSSDNDETQANAQDDNNETNNEGEDDAKTDD